MKETFAALAHLLVGCRGPGHRPEQLEGETSASAMPLQARVWRFGLPAAPGDDGHGGAARRRLRRRGVEMSEGGLEEEFEEGPVAVSRRKRGAGLKIREGKERQLGLMGWTRISF